MDCKRVSDDISIGGQPSLKELGTLRGRGFRTVINFRAEGEEPDQVSPSEEGRKVSAAGLQYVHFPVRLKTISAASVDHLRAAWPNLPKPVFAHCKCAKRAAAMMLAHIGSEHRLNVDQIRKQARDLGLADKPELIDFVCHYVTTHAPAGKEHRDAIPVRR